VSDATITYLVLTAAVVAFVALALWATGVLGLQQALTGFGDPTVIFIASLSVVSEALDATGVTAWAGQRLIASAGESRTRLIVLTMGAGGAAHGAWSRCSSCRSSGRSS
jgi:Na+/H+ antiporter NhaD/arsenite permease-like protein